MNEKDKDNISLLIKIILYLLLALAFFSGYVGFIILTPFLFGILALTCLYVGYYSDKDLNRVGKAFGYVFAGSFILTFGWFILNILIPMEKGKIIVNLLNLLKSEAIQIALLIPLILLIIYLMVNHKRFK